MCVLMNVGIYYVWALLVNMDYSPLSLGVMYIKDGIRHYDDDVSLTMIVTAF